MSLMKNHWRFLAVLATVTVLTGVSVPWAAAQPVSPALFAGMRWRLIGPYRSGNVYAVAGVPNDPDVYYLGMPEGGVWKTTDGGTVWKPIFDQEKVPSIGSIAVATADPSIVYVGTGDPTGWSFTPGRGVYKSTDAGRTWRNVGLRKMHYITTLLVDPNDAKLVLAAGRGERGRGPATGGNAAGGSVAGGVFRSTDGGHNWQHVLALGAHRGVTDMAWDNTDPRNVYAVVVPPSSHRPSSKAPKTTAAPKATPPILYKSSDEGIHWQRLSQHGLPAGMLGATIAVAGGTHGRRVYLEVRGSGRDAKGIYRSDDGGTSWRLMTRQIASAGGRIYVDPQHPDVVYLMGTAVYKSTDGGRTFAAFEGASGGNDPRDMWIDPVNTRRMILGVDQGPTISVDGGQTWTPWYHLPNGQFYDVFTDSQVPYWVYASQQDSGTVGIRSRSDYGQIRTRDWYPVGGFEDGYIAVDPLNPRWIYTQGWYHVVRRFDRKTGQLAVVYTPSTRDHFGGNPPLMYSPENPHRLYLAAQYLLATDNDGKSWKRLSPDLTIRSGRSEAKQGTGNHDQTGRRRRPPTITALAPSSASVKVIWAGTSNGLIQLTRDAGRSWHNVSPPGLTAHARIINLDASHHDAGTAYAAVEESGNNHPHLFRTTDFGSTWQEIVNGLPDNVRTRVVREDPQDPDLLYAGTEMGIWVSFDQGNHWQPLQLNLPHTVVSDLKVHDNDLVISTYGRGLWILDDVTPLRQTRAAIAAPLAYLYRPEPALRIHWSNNHDTPLQWVPVGQNPPNGAIIDYDLKTAARGPVTLSIRDAAGTLVRRYSSAPPAADTSMPNIPPYWLKPTTVLATTPGMHRIAWDLRYPTPKVLPYGYYGDLLDYTEFTLTWPGVKGATPWRQPPGPLAIPGTYTVQLSVDGHTYTRQLKLTMDPRVAVSQAGLEAQLRVEKRVVDGLSTSYDAYQELHALRQKLAREQKRVPRDQALAAAAKKLDTTLAQLISGRGNHGFGAANRDLGRRLQDLEFGDFMPTASDVAAVTASCRQIGAARTQVGTIRQKELPALNRLLAGAHLSPLSLPAAPAVAVCGQ